MILQAPSLLPCFSLHRRIEDEIHLCFRALFPASRSEIDGLAVRKTQGFKRWCFELVELGMNGRMCIIYISYRTERSDEIPEKNR